MTQKQIVRKRDTLIRRLKALNLEVHTLQDRVCKHPAAKREARSNTGNWCKQDDCYWYDCSCPDCGKLWMEDQ